MESSNEHIILFDGVCNLCNGLVKFIIKHDPKARFKFASLQSDAGQALLEKHKLSAKDFDSIIYLQDTSYYVKSSAVLHILKDMKGIWQLLYLTIITPSPIRDFAYSIIAKYRYKIFGKRTVCMIPTPDVKSRFIE